MLEESESPCMLLMAGFEARETKSDRKFRVSVVYIQYSVYKYEDVNGI